MAMTARGKSKQAPPKSRWQGVLAVLFVMAFLAAWGAGWIYVRNEVPWREDYVLRAENVVLSQPPPWIRSDIKSEVLRDASLDQPLSLLDENLTQRVFEAFPLHPWIARVERVTKHFPAKVTVDVVYRRPVCMVEVPGGVYPVDEQSYLLPSGDFSPVDASRFPLLRGIDTRPGPPGTPWGDQHVLEGCRLAAVLGEVWLELQLASFAPLSPHDDPHEPCRFELTTRGGARIVWGHSPPPTPAARLTVEAKIARLRHALSQTGDFDPRRTITLEALDEGEAR
jgi:hypothetical protein